MGVEVLEGFFTEDVPDSVRKLILDHKDAIDNTWNCAQDVGHDIVVYVMQDEAEVPQIMALPREHFLAKMPMDAALCQYLNRPAIEAVDKEPPTATAAYWCFAITGDGMVACWPVKVTTMSKGGEA